ncbi:hypothetical protein PPERSA_04003 [Pseudocohnilembus persalinus]|uniref:Uncharacterized protein n=1 Tax=Pseudocohnilembus persalinus TaxID=266149 RepID=A0A0V0QLC1_PSEPJ|nr:hypothetical protein PPERSA_04003 [Pseudocohnilembus persalinus]|eukprot:KRX02800.1 hypothetical protein PPERSA_04003 [Pseudocohnilembus persalinus]
MAKEEPQSNLAKYFLEAADYLSIINDQDINKIMHNPKTAKAFNYISVCYDLELQPTRKTCILAHMFQGLCKQQTEKYMNCQKQFKTNPEMQKICKEDTMELMNCIDLNMYNMLEQ